MRSTSYMQTNYFIVRETCRKGCICNEDKTIYRISNVLWEYNQRKLLESRFFLSEAEKDEVIQKQLFSKLKETILDSGTAIQNSNQRFPLTFQEVFIDPSNENSVVYELCEDCWILYNKHKGNCLLNLKNFQKLSNVCIIYRYKDL